ncbi:MAG: sigma-54-dependent Fis family transcriptional regulator [candidate division Zixibacteria bacterium]|nr:sigma-54-dependent Fis family transcriptional regulator [candidate division Zixibacteria bacterium]
MPKILIVDDEISQRDMLAGFLKKKKFEVLTASNGVDALEKYGSFFSPLAIIDMKMPEMGGPELLEKLRELNPFIQVIVLTAFGTVETAVNAMRAGAFGYLTKPVNLDELLVNLKKANEQNRLVVDNDILRRTRTELADMPELIGDSEPMMKIRSLISRVGPSDASVLITGPSGTGKGLVAEIIHQLSPRKDNSFVPLNCASLPETLLESELFGHEKGAFTGADKRRAGRFELADTGTIFLDEIGDMTAPMQAKLLRVLEDGTFEPLGSDKSKKVDVRLISATNRDIQKFIDEGKFRQDLYFRINTVNIEMPPLCDRGGDILLLAERFLSSSAKKMNKKIEGISEDAAAVMVAYHWPGNVRELQNVIERAVVLTIDDIIDVDVLPGLSGRESQSLAFKKISLSEMEKEHITAVLNSENWNMQKSSEILGIHRNTLRQKIKDYGIEK